MTLIGERRLLFVVAAIKFGETAGIKYIAVIKIVKTSIDLDNIPDLNFIFDCLGVTITYKFLF